MLPQSYKWYPNLYLDSPISTKFNIGSPENKMSKFTSKDLPQNLGSNVPASKSKSNVLHLGIKPIQSSSTAQASSQIN